MQDDRPVVDVGLAKASDRLDLLGLSRADAVGDGDLRQARRAEAEVLQGIDGEVDGHEPRVRRGDRVRAWKR